MGRSRGRQINEVGEPAHPPIRLGVSSCLLGNAVRWDGGHKRDAFVTDGLGPFVEWVPVCPEVELGMPIPRATLRLSGEGDRVRMVEVASGRDHTAPMKRYAAKRVKSLRELELCGYILKRDSPSCGMTGVKVWREEATAARSGQGLYAAALMKAYPQLPVEDEGRLQDAKFRENFVERVFAYRRLRGLFARRWTHEQVLAFHTAHELQLRSHSTRAYHALTRQLAAFREVPRRAFREGYEEGFMAALAVSSTRARHAKALGHAVGQLGKRLDASSRAEVDELILQYRAGGLPLIAPITLLRHHARVLEVAPLAGQTYLEPHPMELALRNHA